MMKNMHELGLNPSMVCLKICCCRWVFTIRNLDNQYHVFYVDWGNEEKVEQNRIRICPESIRYIPWLANRVKFHNEQLTTEEFDGKNIFYFY